MSSSWSFSSIFGDDSKKSPSAKRKSLSSSVSSASYFSSTSTTTTTSSIPKRVSGTKKSSPLQRARLILIQAVKKDETGDRKGALNDYRTGLKCLLECMKQETDPQRKTRLRSQVKQYLDRAEELKKELGITESTGKKSKVNEQLRTTIENEIIDPSEISVTFNDVVGLKDVKNALHEMIIIPSLRPDLFKGPLRRPCRGLLLFGPPGNGKTHIAKAVAKEAGATFFSISASSLMSKYLGEGEKHVKALFAIAQEKQPSIIFLDEIDSMLSKRTSGEHEASRRLKTEFLVQMDGVNPKSQSAHVVVIGATNIPENLDDAVMRRFPKRVYVPPPPAKTRAALVKKLISSQKNKLCTRDLQKIVDVTDGYSCSDLKSLCQDAALGPLRDIGYDKVKHAKEKDIKPIQLCHFATSLKTIKPSVPKSRLQHYKNWEKRNQ